MISGFSTGAVWLLLLSMLSSNPGAQAISAKLEQLDAMLIVTELIILGAYFNFAMFLPTGARLGGVPVPQPGLHRRLLRGRSFGAARH